MVRRKGEKPVVHTRQPWSDRHPVAQRIASGDGWFYAWIAERSTPYVRLVRATGLPQERLNEIERGFPMSHDEVAALASAWHADVEDVLASMPNPALMVR